MSKISRITTGAMMAALLLTGLMLGGCSTQSKMSEEDKANFKGGPMPANFKDPYASGGPPPAAQNPSPATPKK